MTTERRLTAPAAAALTFLAAACVLVLEIAAGRLLAPYVGVSLTTYTGIIGAILAGIALGAWLGGRAADRFGAEPLIGPALVLGGLAAMLAVPAVAVVGSFGLGNGVAAIVTLAAVGFVLPAILLSAVAPMIVRATLVDLSRTGSVVGRLSAIGTVGAITGTFLTGFLLLGLVPTRPLIIAVGGLLVVIGVIVAWWLGGDRRATAVLAVAAVGTGMLALGLPSPCDAETTYYCVAINTDDADPDGRYLILDGLTHAYVDLADATALEWGYVRRFADATADALTAADGRFEALHIGGGGFTFPRFLDATYPASRQTVLELDPGLVDIARERLAFTPSERVAVIAGDARRSIGDLEAGRYAVVVGDAFGGLAVPWHLTTREFLGEVRRVMRPGGVLVMNLIDGPELRFVRAEAATMRARWSDVAVIASEATLTGGAGGNVVLVASDTPIDPTAILDRVDAWAEPTVTAIVHGDAPLTAFIAGATELTDDHAPVDQLIGR